MQSGGFTEKAKTALRLAERTATRMNAGYVGTEHILVGLIKEGTGVAARVLLENGAQEAKIVDMIQDRSGGCSHTEGKRRIFPPRTGSTGGSAQTGRPVWRRGCGNRAYFACTAKGRRECCSTASQYAGDFHSEAVC